MEQRHLPEENTFAPSILVPPAVARTEAQDAPTAEQAMNLQTGEMQTEIVTKEMQAAREEVQNAVHATLETILKRRRKMERVAFGLIATYVVAIGLMVVSGKSAVFALWFAHHTQVAVLLMGLYNVVMLLFSGLLTRRKARENSIMLGNSDDLRHIGPLTEALHLGDYRTTQAVSHALTRMLPRLKASDADKLNGLQRNALNKVLGRPIGSPWQREIRDLFKPADAEADLRVAILKAYEQVGEESALSVVEKLAHNRAKSSLQKRVQQAAQACLPFLQARVQAHNASQTLLRAAGALDDPHAPQTLLRAAQNTPDQDGGSLLRTAQPPPAMEPEAQEARNLAPPVQEIMAFAGN